MTVLHAGDQKAAVGGRRHRRYLIDARRSHLLLVDDLAFGIEFGDVSVLLASARLAFADHAGHLTADKHIARRIDRDGVRLVRVQRLDLLRPDRRAVGVVFGDEAVVVAVGDRRRRQIRGRRSGHIRIAVLIERQSIAGGAVGGAHHLRPLHIARGIVFGEIDVLRALVELAPEIAGRVAQHINVAVRIHLAGLRGRRAAGRIGADIERGLRRAVQAGQLDDAALLVGGRRRSFAFGGRRRRRRVAGRADEIKRRLRGRRRKADGFARARRDTETVGVLGRARAGAGRRVCRVCGR